MSKTNPIFIISGKSPLSGFGGGYSTFARNLGKTLLKLHFRVYIIALGDTDSQENTDFGTLITVKAPLLSFNITALPGLPWFSYKFSSRIQKIMSTYPPDTKAIIWGIGPWGLTGSFIKFFSHIPSFHINNYFTTIRHEWKGSLNALGVQDYGILLWIKFICIYYTVVQFLAIWEKITLSTCDSIVTNYFSTEKILVEEFQIPKNKFIRTPFPIQAYIRQGGSNSKPVKGIPKEYILYLSRHDPRKGINMLLHAAKILVERGSMIPLIIGGTGELFEANKKLCAKFKLNNWVKFIGFVSDPTSLMKHATVFCLPTFEEGAGALIINEAMSYKLPIVTTVCDGIQEDIKNGKSGILTPIGDSIKLADALQSVITSSKLRKHLSKNTFKRFQELNNQTLIKNKFINILNNNKI